MTSKELNEARLRVKQSEAQLDYILERFGDQLAAKHGYDVNGIEAVWVYLIRTHHWTPSYVKGLKGEDIRLALDVEMKGLKMKD